MYHSFLIHSWQTDSLPLSHQGNYFFSVCLYYYTESFIRAGPLSVNYPYLLVYAVSDAL